MRVLNKKYWPHQVVLDKTYGVVKDKEPPVAWLDSRISRGVWRRYGPMLNTYVFKRQDDAVMFALRWK